jgi:hypothetical protein
MAAISSDFIMSTEQECLTCVLQTPADRPDAIGELFREMYRQAPTLPGPSGLFNAYGRAYLDSGHVELAMIECHSPYVLPLVIERQFHVVGSAVKQLGQQGMRLLIAANNHSGWLQPGCPVWGSHENYMVEQHPTAFTDAILPFLVTRLYGGAGGVHSSSGFVAGVRSTSMELATGGSTTYSRAIHSTSREEHHMGRVNNRFRYHLILGDGHRCQFNTALQFGATALALKAVIYDKQLRKELAKLAAFNSPDWVALLHRFNVLQQPGGRLLIDPVVVETQRLYLEGARRYAERLSEAPGWIPELLQDWDDTLNAWAALDRPWLAARFDAFAKYEFYTAVLEEAGATWADLPRRAGLLNELTLLDQSYHNFAADDSVFRLLEQDGLLEHRIGPWIPPGSETEPFISEAATRARPRARFIKEHNGELRYMVDWSCIYDHTNRSSARLDDPFAEQIGEWSAPLPAAPAAPTLADIHEQLRRAEAAATTTTPF